MKLIDQDLWDSITESRTDLYRSRHFCYLPLVLIHNTQIYYGKENTTSDVCIMFPAKKESYGVDLPKTEGFQVGIDFLQNNDGKDGVVLRLINLDYLHVFNSLVNDLIQCLSGVKEDEFISTFNTRLNIWKMFFKNEGFKGMSLEKQKGLFGELYFLKNCLVPSLGLDSLKYWTGPDGGTHDFEIGKYAVEVKTTSASTPQVIHISNEKQLNDVGYDRLFVYKVSISTRKNSHPTLIDLINETRELFERNPEKIFALNNLLFRYGYIDGQKDKYLSLGFHLDNIDVFQIEEGFPRILKKDLIPGVGKVRYTVDVSSIEKFKVKTLQFEKYIKG
jgi:hypothetical protein